MEPVLLRQMLHPMSSVALIVSAMLVPQSSTNASSRGAQAVFAPTFFRLVEL